MTTKICIRCGIEKPISEFDKQAARKDGSVRYRADCKSCAYLRFGKKKLENRKTETGRALRRITAAKHDRTSKKKDSARNAAKRYAKRFPEKIAAQQKLLSAIREGKIVRPDQCSKCGSGRKRRDGRSLIQAHHPDYNQPLMVLWLCALCHRREHMNHGE